MNDFQIMKANFNDTWIKKVQTDKFKENECKEKWLRYGIHVNYQTFQLLFKQTLIVMNYTIENSSNILLKTNSREKKSD